MKYHFKFGKSGKKNNRQWVHAGYTENWKQAIIYLLRFYKVWIEEKPKYNFRITKITKPSQ